MKWVHIEDRLPPPRKPIWVKWIITEDYQTSLDRDPDFYKPGEREFESIRGKWQVCKDAMLCPYEKPKDNAIAKSIGIEPFQNRHYTWGCLRMDLQDCVKYWKYPNIIDKIVSFLTSNNL